MRIATFVLNIQVTYYIMMCLEKEDIQVFQGTEDRRDNVADVRVVQVDLG